MFSPMLAFLSLKLNRTTQHYGALQIIHLTTDFRVIRAPRSYGAFTIFLCEISSGFCIIPKIITIGYLLAQLK